MSRQSSFCETCQPIIDSVPKQCICKNICECNSYVCKCFECNRRKSFATSSSVRSRTTSIDWTELEKDVYIFSYYRF